MPGAAGAVGRNLNRTTTYPKMLQSLAERVPAAATAR
jgi:hypothetical protein